MVHTGYLKFATERNIVPKGNAVPKTGQEKARHQLAKAEPFAAPSSYLVEITVEERQT
jgi:hypothetical protein